MPCTCTRDAAFSSFEDTLLHSIARVSWKETMCSVDILSWVGSFIVERFWTQVWWGCCKERKPKSPIKEHRQEAITIKEHLNAVVQSESHSISSPLYLQEEAVEPPAKASQEQDPSATAAVEEVEQTSSHEVQETMQEQQQQQPRDADAPAVVQEAHRIALLLVLLLVEILDI